MLEIFFCDLLLQDLFQDLFISKKIDDISSWGKMNYELECEDTYIEIIIIKKQKQIKMSILYSVEI